jgi:hypothetical protein
MAGQRLDEEESPTGLRVGGRWLERSGSGRTAAGARVRHLDTESGVLRVERQPKPEVTARLPAVPYGVRREFGDEEADRAVRVARVG